MFTFITWKAGVQHTPPHKSLNIEQATVLFNALLLKNSRVQMFVNGNMIKDEVNPTISNTTEKVLNTNG